MARVLVVDDDEGLRTSTAEIVALAGHHVTEAEDGTVALERLEREDYDVVLLDIMMPGPTGIDVVESMDPVPPPPAIVLVTAYDIADDVRRRLGRRVAAIIRKPANPSDLLDAIIDAVASATGDAAD